MPQLRLLASSVLASTLVFPAAAQSPATQSPAVQSNPAPASPAAALALSATITPTLNLSAPAAKPTPPFAFSATLSRNPLHSNPTIANIQLLKPTPSEPGASSTFHIDDATADTLLGLPAGTKISPEQKQNLDKAIAGLNRLKKSRLDANSHSPCAKLRVYGFTPKDLKSAHPQPSTETDCTTLASAHLKPIQATATVTAK